APFRSVPQTHEIGTAALSDVLCPPATGRPLRPPSGPKWPLVTRLLGLSRQSQQWNRSRSAGEAVGVAAARHDTPGGPPERNSGESCKVCPPCIVFTSDTRPRRGWDGLACQPRKKSPIPLDVPPRLPACVLGGPVWNRSTGDRLLLFG